MKPLVLSGRAAEIVPGETFPGEAVLRLRERGSSDAPSPGERDAMLIREPADVANPSADHFRAAVAVGDVAVPAGLFETTIRLTSDFAYLADGDIIGVHSRNQRVRTLYRRSSRHNFFLVTDRCNHYCLMCSQPPKDMDDSWILDQLEAALPLIDPTTRSIGFTGGEPLLQWERFIRLLGKAREELPQTAVHVLTNGRAFSSLDITRAWAGVGHPSLMAGIPIYSAVDHVHDYVVQAPGAFDETVLGVLRLKDQGQRIEIRVVLHQITAPRIVETARWLARNLPFVNHVALMGLENTGFAIANHDLLWIDPIDYKRDLALAVDILDAARINVSIYNLPYCVLDPSVWPFARQSISDWKNAYLPQCDECQAKSQCAGFFSSGRPRNSRAIKPLEVFDLAR
jgi:His-Xaa-Ser system radical SAM maturase HxsC